MKSLQRRAAHPEEHGDKRKESCSDSGKKTGYSLPFSAQGQSGDANRRLQRSPDWNDPSYLTTF